MKLTIDTTNKTIQIEDEIEIFEFIREIADLLPNGANLEEWTIIPTVINYNIPTLPNIPWECPITPPDWPIVIRSHYFGRENTNE